MIHASGSNFTWRARKASASASGAGMVFMAWLKARSSGSSSS